MSNPPDVLLQLLDMRAPRYAQAALLA